jgi:hypothetical protein
MYHYLTVDGYFHGTGIRDSVEGGFVELELLAISPDLKDRIKKWVLQYEAEHYNHYADEENIEKLDIEGKEIAILLKKELIHVKVKYYSAANSKKELV